MGLSWTAALFVGGALTATSVSISARTLVDGGHMACKEATVILGVAVIDDVMGLFVLAFLTATLSSGSGESFGVVPAASRWTQDHVAFAAKNPLTIQMTLISLSVAAFFFIVHGAARRWLDPLILQMRKLSSTAFNDSQVAMDRVSCSADHAPGPDGFAGHIPPQESRG